MCEWISKLFKPVLCTLAVVIKTYRIIRYDTIRQKSLTWAQKLSVIGQFCVYVRLCTYSYAIYRGVGKGDKGDMSPSEIATLKIFSVNSMEFLTFNHILSIIFGFLGLCPRPHPGLCIPLVTEPTLLSPPKQIPGYAPGHLCMLSAARNRAVSQYVTVLNNCSSWHFVAIRLRVMIF